jgi:hypothetical protein
MPADLLRGLKEIPAEQLLRLVRGMPGAERKARAEQQSEPSPSPPPPSARTIVAVDLKEKSRPKRKVKREEKLEEGEEEEFQEKLDDEEDVGLDVLEKLKEIGVREM